MNDSGITPEFDGVPADIYRSIGGESPIGSEYKKIGVNSNSIKLSPDTKGSVQISGIDSFQRAATQQLISGIIDSAINEIKKNNTSTKKEVSDIIDTLREEIVSQTQKSVLDFIVSEIDTNEPLKEKIKDIVFGGSESEGTASLYRGISDTPKNSKNYRTMGSEPSASDSYRPMGSTPKNSDSYRAMGSNDDSSDNYTSISENRSGSKKFRAMGESGEDNASQPDKINNSNNSDSNNFSNKSNTNATEKGSGEIAETIKSFEPREGDWANEGVVSEIEARRPRPQRSGGGFWSGFYWWGGGEGYQNTSQITGKYFGINLITGAVEFSDTITNQEQKEWRYVADKNEDTGEYTLSSRTSGDIVFRIV